MEIINLKNIHKKYTEGKQHEVHALQGVNLTINKGDSIAFSIGEFMSGFQPS